MLAILAINWLGRRRISWNAPGSGTVLDADEGIEPPLPEAADDLIRPLPTLGSERAPAGRLKGGCRRRP